LLFVTHLGENGCMLPVMMLQNSYQSIYKLLNNTKYQYTYKLYFIIKTSEQKKQTYQLKITDMSVLTYLSSSANIILVIEVIMRHNSFAKW